MVRLLLFILIIVGFGSDSTVFAQKLIREFVVNSGSPVERVYYLEEDKHMVIMGNQASCYAEKVIFYKNGEKVRQYNYGEGFVGDIKLLANGPELIYIGIPSDVDVIYGMTRALYNFDGEEIKKEGIPLSNVEPYHGFEHVSSCLIQDGVYFQTNDGKIYVSVTDDWDETQVLPFATIEPNIPADILVQQTGFDSFNPTYDVIVATNKILYSFKRYGNSHQLLDNMSFDTIQFIKHYDNNKMVVVTNTHILTLNNQLNEIGMTTLPIGFKPSGLENNTIYLRSDLQDDGQQAFIRTHTIKGFDLNTFNEVSEYNLHLAPYYVKDIFIKNDTVHVAGHSKIHTQSIVQMYDLKAPASIQSEFIDIEVLNVQEHSRRYIPYSYALEAELDVTVRHNFGKTTPALMSSVHVAWPAFCTVTHTKDYNDSLSESQEITVRIPVVTYTYAITDGGDSIEFADVCGYIFGVGTHMDIDMTNNWFCSGNIKFPLSTTSTENNNIAEKWSISPNPANESININFESNLKKAFKIQLLNFQGKVTRTLEFPAGNETLNIQTSDLIPGIYIIQLVDQKSGQLIDTKKLIKQ